MTDTPDFLKEFASQLDSLTFNSGPIISQLARSSEEHIEYAQQIVDLIETRIEKCLPKHKLFTFYVLDSICKNVGRPYTIFFQRNLAKLFKQTYLIIDNETRQKLINVFKTWLNSNSGSNNNNNTSSFDEDEYDSAIFDKEVLKNIETFLIRASAVHEKNTKKTDSINFQPPTIPSLLREIDKLIILCNDKVTVLQQRLNTAMGSLNPTTLYNQSHQQQQLVHQQQQQLQSLIMDEINNTQPKIMVLQELKKEIMKGTITMDALVQVQQQLRVNFQKEHQELMRLNTPVPQTQQHQQQPQQATQMGSIFGDEPINHSKVVSNIFGNDPQEQIDLTSNTNIHNDANDNSVAHYSAPSNSILKDLEELKKKKLQKLVAKLKENDLLKEVDSDHSILTVWDKYCKNLPLNNQERLDSSIQNLPDINILQHIVKDLNSSKIDIGFFVNSPIFRMDNKQINENFKSCFPFIQLLYRYKPEKCSICGKRYHTTTNSVALMSSSNVINNSIHDHLDWHFRINKRINMNKGRAGLASRSWFMDEDQWIDTNPSGDSSSAAMDLDLDKLSSLQDYNNENNNHKKNKRTYTDNEQSSERYGNADEDGIDDDKNSMMGVNNFMDNKTEDMPKYINSINEMHKKHKNYKAIYTIIPDSYTSMQVDCQVCKEALQASYNESIGQWVWQNCVEDNGKYSHATCFYESKR